MNQNELFDSPLGKLISNAVSPHEQALNREAVLQRFASHLPSSDPGDFALALYPFVAIRPLCYFSSPAFEKALTLFEKDPQATFRALSKFAQGLSHAMDSLLRAGASSQLEGQLELGKPENLMSFERIWHPEYQRHAEHVFNHVVKIPLELLGNAAGKDFLSLTLSLRADKLTDLCYPEFAAGFMSTVRNAISHGSTFYGDHEIRYVDSKHEEALFASDFSRLFDDLVDTCSGIVVAMFAFVVRHQLEAAAFGFNLLPLGLRCALVKGWMSHSGFTIDGMIEVIGGTSSHLNIFCSSPTKSRSFHRYQALRTAAYAVLAGCSSYDRICVSIDCGLSAPASMILNCPQLIEALRPGATVKDLAAVVQTDLLWYDANFVSRKWFLLNTIATGVLSRARRDMVSHWKKSGLKVWKHRYAIRNVENRSVGSKRRVLAEVVLNPDEEISSATVLGVVRHAVKTLGKSRVSAMPIDKLVGARGRPSYVWLRLHSTDARVRTLQGRSRRSGELLVEVEWMTWLNRSQPIFVKQPHEVVEGIRICYHGFKP